MTPSTEAETTVAQLGRGLLGCGALGRFCLGEFGAMPGLRAAAVADTVPEAARQTGEEFGVPVCADIHALAARVPHAEIEAVAYYEGADRDVLARHKTFPAEGRFRIRGQTGMAKQELYGHIVRSLLADQIQSIDNPQRHRLVSEENGLTFKQVRERTFKYPLEID